MSYPFLDPGLFVSVVWIMHHLSTPCTMWAPYPLGVKSVLGKAFCFAFRSFLSNTLSDSALSSSSYTCALPGTWTPLARCSGHLPATGLFLQTIASNSVVSEEGESRSLYHVMICGVRRRGKQELVPFCDPWCQQHLTFQMSKFSAGAAQPALISVCAAHRLTLVWMGGLKEPHHPPVGWQVPVQCPAWGDPPWSSRAAPSVPPGWHSLSFAFPSAGPTAVAAEPQTRSPGHLSAETVTPAHGPHSPTAVQWFQTLEFPSAAVISQQQCQAPAPWCCPLSRCWKA